MIEEHRERTGSPVAAGVLERFEELLASGAFVKVMPHDYKRVLRERAEEEELAVGTGGEPAATGEPQAGARPLDAVGEAGS
jgi:glutamate synthase (NADPH/NADH) large chain/glutamate synthase (ferredoxin)